MREHLSKLHEAEAGHHDHKSEHHLAIAGHYRKLASSFSKTETSEAQKDFAGLLETMAGMHEVTSQKHAAHAEFHRDCAEKCNKAMDAADLNKLVPTRVSAIAPERPTITPVPRYGAPPLHPQNVEPELVKALGLDEESMHEEERSLRQ